MQQRARHGMDGVYYRVKRDGRWTSICFSDMTEYERNSVVGKVADQLSPEEQAGYWRSIANTLADQLYAIGEHLGIMEDDEE